MNAPLIARPTVRLTIAKGLVADLTLLSDAAFRTFVEVKRQAEAAVPELLAAGAASDTAFGLFLSNSGDAQLFIEFDAKTESFVITGFRIDDFDPPPGPAARRLSATTRARTIFARLRLHAADLQLDDQSEVAGRPLRALVVAAVARPNSVLALMPEELGTRKAVHSESRSKMERRPSRRSVFFGEPEITDSFSSASMENRCFAASSSCSGSAVDLSDAYQFAPRFIATTKETISRKRDRDQRTGLGDAALHRIKPGTPSLPSSFA